MTSEDKAQALVDAVRSEYPLVADFHAAGIALCRIIEQHEAFKQEVSDIVHHYVYADGGQDYWEKLKALIIPAPKPDPLVEIISEIEDGTYGETKAEYAAKLRDALDARGLEIREKNDD